MGENKMNICYTDSRGLVHDIHALGGGEHLNPPAHFNSLVALRGCLRGSGLKPQPDIHSAATTTALTSLSCGLVAFPVGAH